MATLREYERLGKLQTLAISYLPYSELKRRWVSSGHSLIVSNYGENHDYYQVEPLPPQNNLQLSGIEGVPPGILQYLAQLTGLYPEVCEATLQHWVDLGSPNLVPSVKESLRLRAERSCERMIEWLDPESTRFYRDHLTNLHLKIDVDDAVQALGAHPWKRILLDEDTELLRAECLGSAALRKAMDEAVKKKVVVSNWMDLSAQSLRLYRNRRYAESIELLSSIVKPTVRDSILLQHAKVMNCLHGSGLDIDWEWLRRAIRSARDTVRGETAIDDVDRLIGRYTEIEELANTIVAAQKHGPRIVDTLAGLGRSSGDPESAALLIVLWLDNCRSITSNSLALSAALPLPEQIFRIWAFWMAGISYDQAPGGDEVAAVWDDAKGAWPQKYGVLQPISGGKGFDSFHSFAYFSLASAHRLGLHETALPEADFRSLEDSLSFHSGVRNPGAHSLSLVGRRSIERYFALIERWLAALFCCPCLEKTCSQDLMLRTEPLPTVENDGTINWGVG